MYFRPFLENLSSIVKNDVRFREFRARLQLISTDTWDISDSLSKYTDLANILIVSKSSYCFHYYPQLLQNSITIVEDVSEESEAKVRDHLQQIVNKLIDNPLTVENPWLEEIWRAKSGCLENQLTKICVDKNLDQFKIDSKVNCRIL